MPAAVRFGVYIVPGCVRAATQGVVRSYVRYIRELLVGRPTPLAYMCHHEKYRYGFGGYLYLGVNRCTLRPRTRLMHKTALSVKIITFRR